MTLEKPHRDVVYRSGDLLDAAQVAEVVSQNGKPLHANGVSAFLARRNIEASRSVGRANLYRYDDVKDLCVGDKPGRKALGPGGRALTAAEKQKRYYERKKLAVPVPRAGGQPPTILE